MANEEQLVVATTVYDHQLARDGHIESTNYLRRRRTIVQEQIKALQREEKALDIAIEFMSTEVCPACKGQREFWHHTSHDEGFWEPCGACNGTGRTERKASEQPR